MHSKSCVFLERAHACERIWFDNQISDIKCIRLQGLYCIHLWSSRMSRLQGALSGANNFKDFYWIPISIQQSHLVQLQIICQMKPDLTWALFVLTTNDLMICLLSALEIVILICYCVYWGSRENTFLTLITRMLYVPISPPRQLWN